MDGINDGLAVVSCTECKIDGDSDGGNDGIEVCERFEAVDGIIEGITSNDFDDSIDGAIDGMNDGIGEMECSLAVDYVIINYK